MHFKKGAIAAAMILAGCTGEQADQSLTCPEGMAKTERYGLEQCSPESVDRSKRLLTQLDSSLTSSSLTSTGSESGEVELEEGVNEVTLPLPNTPISQDPPEAPEHIEIATSDRAGQATEPKQYVDTPIQEMTRSSIEKILADYERALQEDSDDGEIKRLSSHDLHQILYAHLKKVNFNDVDKALKALDEEAPMPWEVEDDEQTLDEINERSIEVVVKRGDSFLGVLSREGISTSFFYQLSKSDQRRLSDFNVGDRLSITEEEGVLYSLSREMSPLKTLLLERVGDEYALSEEITDPETRLKRYHFELTSSLYINGNRAGLNDNTIANLQRILGERINFSRDIQKGDQFTLILREPVFNGQVVGRPSIAGAKISRSNGREIYALRYENSDGRVRYYDKDGSSLQTGFMREPVNHTRISSHFNPNRKHPVTGRVRPHLGTDFAAPTGTPIYAASDGQVTRAGWASGYGNVVYIDHGNGVQTRYAHMSRFNTRRGRQVSRGDVIGYVGMTGTATGPHLHYEYRENGRALNPMTVNLPTADPVPQSEMSAFREQISEVVSKISS